MVQLSHLLAGACLVLALPSSARKLPFTNLVTFGDSYTDDGRLWYYVENNGKGPPPGVLPTVANVTSGGALSWGQYIQQFSPGLNYVNYAISGATCSNEIIARYNVLVNENLPSVIDDAIPSFKQDVNFTSIYPDRTAKNTVYALWIGTNDLGFNGFLSDSQAPGTTITNYTDCIWSVFDQIYQTGGRRFVLMNLAPLQLTPMYTPISEGGIGDGQYWNNKSLYNTTEYSQKMLEYTSTVNTLFEYGVPFNTVIKSRWPGAVFTLFDVHSLLVDIYKNPKSYLDAPYNVTGYYSHCFIDGRPCVNESDLGPLSGFLWFDELHPSYKADSIIAENFIDVVAGNSTYATSYGCLA